MRRTDAERDPFPDLPRIPLALSLATRSHGTRYVSCSSVAHDRRQEGTMYYGIGGAILLVIIVLILTGRI
jgi:hypothetical protein